MNKVYTLQYALLYVEDIKNIVKHWTTDFGFEENRCHETDSLRSSLHMQ